jgi:SAM-dependent methyltransferase
VSSSPRWLDPAIWRTRAASFGPAARLYDAVRPSYPSGAIIWALQPVVTPRPAQDPVVIPRVVDLGAGTGILTRQLVALGYHVLAVEPDDQMRARLAETLPTGGTGRITVLAGSAERIPLPGSSVDAVLAAQAYHWFHREQAHLELARVTRPGGVFAAIWNVRDDAVPWVGAYSRIVEGHRGPDGIALDGGRLTDPDFGPGFGPVTEAEFRHQVRHTPDSLLSLLRSRSYFLTATPAGQAALESAVAALTAGHPDLAGRAAFDLPYLTRVYRAIRLTD